MSTNHSTSATSIPTAPAAGAPTDVLPSQYKPGEHERRIRGAWERSGAFHAEPARVLSGEREPFCVLIPPPNVTAALHLGHAFNNTLQDVLVRAHRMMGYETLWMPGTDHAGIATQAVVERRLREEGSLKGPLRDAMTREQFVAKAQAWKDEYEAKILGQLKAMGCSCDWERTRFTMDPVCARAVREAFFQLFRAGLIYRGKRLVNWDPVLQTAVADDELEMREVEGKFYYLRYPLVCMVEPTERRTPGVSTMPATTGSDGKPAAERADWRPVTWSELAARGYPGAANFPEDQPAWVTVATTRPETYLGDTAVAVNPKDPRAVALRGLMVELPIVGRVIPIIEDDYVVMPAGRPVLRAGSPTPTTAPHAADDASNPAADPDGTPKDDPKAKYATGFLKVTPAHDENDYALYQRHKPVMDAAAGGDGRALINIMAPDASISKKHGWSDREETKAAHLFMGLSREKARDLVIREFQSREIGSETLLEAIKPYTHTVPYSDRSKVPIEPWLSDQWYVKVTDDRLRGEAQRALAIEQRSEASLGGTGLQHVPEWLANLPRIPTIRPAGFVSRDPYPPMQPSPSDLMSQIRDLPHLTLPGATYFVTWRTHATTLTDSERDTALAAIAHWHNVRWQVYAACVMPDHVHLIARPLADHELGDIVGSVKRHAAREINKARGEEGPLWQPERFDHIVRDETWLASFLEYLLENPVKEGLTERASQYRWLVLQGAVTAAVLQRAQIHRSGLRPEHRLQACATGDSTLQFFPERYAKTYEAWHDNLRDWCVSRQLWWGHRIPVWTYAGGWGYHQDRALEEFIEADRICFMDDSSAVRASDMQSLSGAPFGESHFKHVCVRDEHDSKAISTLEKMGFTHDPDVLDTWFSSAAWPISTLGWPGGSGLQPEYGPQAHSDRPESQDSSEHRLQACAIPEPDMLAAFNPSTVLCTGRDIITLWVSRMVMFNRFLREGTPPFRDVYINPIIQDGHGQRMSKSLGNGVDPLDIVHSHGADAMRFVLTQIATSTQDVRMPVDLVCPHTGKTFEPKFITSPQGYLVAAPIQESPGDPSKKMVTPYGAASGAAKPTADMPVARNTSSKFDLGRNFCNKLWNASRFAIGILGKTASGSTGLQPVSMAQPSASHQGGSADTGCKPVLPKDLPLVDRWMLSRVQATTESVTQSIRSYQFASYAQAMYDLMWRDFCDWYLEAIKPTVAESRPQQAVLAHTLESIVRLLHPLVPFITEAIWERLRHVETAPIEGVRLSPSRVGDLLCTAGWPQLDPSLRDERAEAVLARVQALSGAIREVRAKHQVLPKRRIVLHATPALAEEIRAAGGIVESLCALSTIQITPPPRESVAFTFDAGEYRLSGLADAVDATTERDRLAKQIADLRRSIAALEGRLANPGYTDRAPPSLVQQTRDEKSRKEADLSAALAAMQRLT